MPEDPWSYRVRASCPHAPDTPHTHTSPDPHPHRPRHHAGGIMTCPIRSSYNWSRLSWAQRSASQSRWPARLLGGRVMRSNKRTTLCIKDVLESATPTHLVVMLHAATAREVRLELRDGVLQTLDVPEQALGRMVIAPAPAGRPSNGPTGARMGGAM